MLWHPKKYLSLSQRVHPGALEFCLDPEMLLEQESVVERSTGSGVQQECNCDVVAVGSVDGWRVRFLQYSPVRWPPPKV